MRPLAAKTTTVGKNLCTFYGIRYQQSYFEQGIKTKKTSESHRTCRQGVTKEKRVIKYKTQFMNMEEKKKKKSIRLKKNHKAVSCVHMFLGYEPTCWPQPMLNMRPTALLTFIFFSETESYVDE